MKNLYIAIYILIFSILTSCIENYDVVMEDTGNEILIVEGQIVGGKECEFILQRSSCKPKDYEQTGPNLITKGVILHVICSDGQVFGVNRCEGARYYVNVGELDPNETYHLRIQIGDEGVYESEPMYPIPAPQLKQVRYTLSDDGKTVQLRITNEDPHGEMYYMWTYDEHWEINTPLITEWTYSPELDAIVPLEQKINRGWCSKANNPIIFGNNLDYGNGALRDYVIYTLSNRDNRFNTRYHTKISQIAISKEEYEYYKQMEAQSTQTGGIFTLMPTQLPTNIHNNLGFKAEGYIGVHLKSSDAEIYINNTDVGHRAYLPDIVPDSIVSATSPYALHDKGYRVYRYDQSHNKAEWARAWCVDCRDPFWGASLERPDSWKDN